MSVHEFWEEDPDLFWAYRFSYLTKVKRDRNWTNEQAWLQGMYFCEAISVSLANLFGDKKAMYRNEPFDLYSTKKVETKPKVNMLEEQIKARAMKIESMLKGNDRSDKRA